MKKIIQISRYTNEMLQSSNFSSEWTDISDCCPPTGNGEIKFIDYWRTENAYIEDILIIMSSLNIVEFFISNIEIEDAYKELIPQRWRVGARLLVDDLDFIVRNCLRGYFWCRIYFKEIFFLTFGYDMYVHVGLDVEDDISPSNSLVHHKDISERLEDVESYYFGRGET